MWGVHVLYLPLCTEITSVGRGAMHNSKDTLDACSAVSTVRDFFKYQHGFHARTGFWTGPPQKIRAFTPLPRTQ